MPSTTHPHILHAAGQHYAAIATTQAGRSFAKYLTQGGVSADEAAVSPAELPALRKRLLAQITALRDAAAEGGEDADIIAAIHLDMTRLAKLVGAGRIDRRVMRAHARRLAAQL